MGMEIPFAEKNIRRKTVKEAIGSLPKAGQSGDPVHDMPENRTPKVLEIIRRIPRDGGSHRDLPEEFQLECHKRCTGFKDVYRRMAWNEVAPTITSGCFNPSKGRFLHPEENRAITMREAALLQGFPRRYKFPTTDNKSAVALMIGNALPPKRAEFLTKSSVAAAKPLFAAAKCWQACSEILVEFSFYFQSSMFVSKEYISFLYGLSVMPD